MRHIFIRIFISFLLYFTSIIQINADTLNFEIGSINNADKLPSQEIRRIHQDKDGFIWFGSTNGLIRYDGYDFLHYIGGGTNTLTNNDITTITDNNDNVWIGTRRGVNIFNKQTQTITTLNNELDYQRIYKITCDDDYIWFGTKPYLYRYKVKTKELKLYPLEGQVQGDNINDILITSEGDILVSLSSYSGLYKYNPQSDNFEKLPKIFKESAPQVIFQDKGKNLWLGSWEEGIVQVINYDTDFRNIITRRFIHNTDNLKSISANRIYSISQDKVNGAIWVGHHKGISILENPDNNSSFRNIKFDGTNNSITNNSISAILCDNSGNIWLGTMGGGVNQVTFPNNLFRYNLLRNIIVAILWLCIKINMNDYG